MASAILAPRWISIKNYGYSGLFGHTCDYSQAAQNMPMSCDEYGDMIFGGPYRPATLVLLFLCLMLGVVSLAGAVFTQFWFRHQFFSITALLNMVGSSCGYVGTHLFCEQFAVDNEALNPIVSKWSDLIYEYGYFLYLGGVNLLLMGGLSSGLVRFAE